MGNIKKTGTIRLSGEISKPAKWMYLDNHSHHKLKGTGKIRIDEDKSAQLTIHLTHTLHLNQIPLQDSSDNNFQDILQVIYQRRGVIGDFIILELYQKFFNNSWILLGEIIQNGKNNIPIAMIHLLRTDTTMYHLIASDQKQNLQRFILSRR